MPKRKTSDYTPDPTNANAGTERGLRALDDSLAKYGAGRSILVDKNGYVIAGNKTLERAVDMGMDDAIEVETDGHSIVVVKRTDLDLLNDPRARELAYADNRVAELDLTWNAEQLLADLNAGVDLSQFWREDELQALLDGLVSETPVDAGAQVDKAAELQEKWQVNLGDVWCIGKHTLVCDDATRDDWQEGRVLITDPPYGINYDPSWLDGVGTHRRALSSRDTLANDDGSLDLTFLFEYDRRMIWGFPYIYDPKATGWIVWDKQPGVSERGIVTPVEMASTTLRKGFDMIRVMWGGYYRAAGETREPHPTQKPVQVVQPFIEQWTKADDVIYDPFGGSGTVMVAAENTGRVSRLVEIEPKFCAVILQRMSDMGLTPTRE